MNPLFFLGIGIAAFGLMSEKRKKSIDSESKKAVNGDSENGTGTVIANEGTGGENEKPNQNNPDDSGN